MEQQPKHDDLQPLNLKKDNVPVDQEPLEEGQQRPQIPGRQAHPSSRTQEKEPYPPRNHPRK